MLLDTHGVWVDTVCVGGIGPPQSEGEMKATEKDERDPNARSDKSNYCSCGCPKPRDMGCCEGCAEPERESWR